MARTNATLVEALLGNNYDTENNPDLGQFVDMATLFIDRVVVCADAKGVTLSTEEEEILERWWAAHLYTKLDPLYTSKSTLSASGSWVQGKEPERYKAGAIELDPSGCVKALSNRQTARMVWGGKAQSEMVDYEDRN